MIPRAFIAVLLSFVAGSASADALFAGRSSEPSFSATTPLPLADRVVVYKAERKLELHRKGEVLRSMDIALGLVPEGHKEQEGDFRTPEGEYLLDEKNPDSDFFLSIHVSYPNQRDERRAASRGVDPGGQIMIHGLPNELTKPLRYYSGRDWTDGCIAVSNADMVDIWLMTAENTPIQILP